MRSFSLPYTINCSLLPTSHHPLLASSFQISNLKRSLGNRDSELASLRESTQPLLGRNLFFIIRLEKNLSLYLLKILFLVKRFMFLVYGSCQLNLTTTIKYFSLNQKPYLSIMFKRVPRTYSPIIIMVKLSAMKIYRQNMPCMAKNPLFLNYVKFLHDLKIHSEMHQLNQNDLKPFTSTLEQLLNNS